MNIRFFLQDTIRKNSRKNFSAEKKRIKLRDNINALLKDLYHKNQIKINTSYDQLKLDIMSYFTIED